MDAHPECPCTVLFADIAGSTGLYEALGDRAAKDLITRLQDAIVRAAAGTGGRVHEIVGDEVMFRFASPTDGAAGALAIQRAADAFAHATATRLGVRVGLHTGRVIVDGDRLFGDTINVAARVTAIAQGGQIITTQAVVEQLPLPLRSRVRRFDVAPLKGKRAPLLVYDLPWQQRDLTAIGPLTTGGAAAQRLTLVHAGQTRELRPDSAVFTLGRDPASDLVVDSPSVSRQHATISVVRGRFVLIDASTNGTHVVQQDREPVFLRRESLPLGGRGEIALGAPPDAADDHRVAFRCD